MSKPSVLLTPKFFLPFLIAWSVLLVFSGMPFGQYMDYGLFSLLGVLGAIFANSTGAGGGVIFIPMFNQLAFTEAQAIATSFGIQCFGMTAGAITWYQHYRQEKRDLTLWHGFNRIILVSTLASIAGIWVIYGYDVASPASLHQSFSWFSLLLGAFIVCSVYFIKPKRESSKLVWFDYIAIVLICLAGGAITAWLSVGVGELLAIYLILRRFDVTMAVAAAVVVSALTVWSAIWQHTLVDFNVYWQVVVFAGPGAVLGGIIAKSLVTYLSARRLKLFFAFWLLVIGTAGI
ncbi:sulfite exporter TauE/SafE family protein [Thalassotalea euphylliae]|uniref:sulfite exporter TauE/SafE family protein n=1 Tax=Thalassotalea euphylliae TaxID=1655234 RepID=UPI0036426001